MAQENPCPIKLLVKGQNPIDDRELVGGMEEVIAEDNSRQMSQIRDRLTECLRCRQCLLMRTVPMPR